MEWGSSGKTHYEGQDLLADLMLQVVVFFLFLTFMDPIQRPTKCSLPDINFL